MFEVKIHSLVLLFTKSIQIIRKVELKYYRYRFNN